MALSPFTPRQPFRLRTVLGLATFVSFSEKSSAKNIIYNNTC